MAVVLLRPKSPGNVGSVARGMKNMGFTRLVVADPMTYDDPAYFDSEARRMAWQATDVLEARLTAPDLDEALSPFHIVAGTTSDPPEGARVMPPRELAAELSARLSREPSSCMALLFGQEDIGLTREHLARCHLVGTIPAAFAYPSLNLAQAALLFLYELRLALLEHVGPALCPQAATPKTAPADPLPSHGELEGFHARLERALDDIGFLQGTAKAHMMRELRTIFNRALLTQRELAILEGVVHQVMWAARRRG